MSDIGPLDLALGVAIRLNREAIDLAGLDGYQKATLADQQLAQETQSLLSEFIARHPEISVTSVTRTLYEVSVASIYGRLFAMP